MNLYVCPSCAKALAVIADVVNGPGVGPPAAMTIGNLRIYLVQPTPEMDRHENMHTVQCERYCPRWLRWLPWRARVWAGTPGFLAAYRREHLRVGYDENPFEIEARSVEGS